MILQVLTAPYPGTWGVPDHDTLPGDYGSGAVRAFSLGSGDGRHAITVDHPPDRGGFVGDIVGATLFERIHVILFGHALGKWGFRDLDAVLSAVAEPTEVWNSFRRVDQTLSAITTETGGGFAVADPDDALPSEFPALRSRFYTILIDLDGPPTLDDFATFDFGLSDLIQAPGHVIGIRLVPFPFRFNPPVRSFQHWLTDVITSADGSEQRIALRDLPRRGVSGTVQAFEDDEAAYLQALLFGWNARTYGVPLEFHAGTLGAAAASGDLSIQLESTADRDLIPTRIGLLWRAHNVWEAVVIETVEDDGITLTIRSPLKQDWPARSTSFLPLRLGHLDNAVPLTRAARHATTMSITFLLEQAP